jgi:hypothetical protein
MNRSIQLLEHLISLGNSVSLATGTVTNSLSGDDRISPGMIISVLEDIMIQYDTLVDFIESDTDTSGGTVIQFPGR